MLVLSRRLGEKIIIDDVTSVEIVEIDRGKVRLGIVAPERVRVDRSEVHERRLQFADGDEANLPAPGVN